VKGSSSGRLVSVAMLAMVRPPLSICREPSLKCG
jgi:hypothetical protein